jgi:hypothetical protein
MEVTYHIGEIAFEHEQNQAKEICNMLNSGKLTFPNQKKCIIH